MHEHSHTRLWHFRYNVGMNPTIATDAFDNGVGRNAENKPGDSGNIFLVGMMGAGKTTVAKLAGGLLRTSSFRL